MIVPCDNYVAVSKAQQSHVIFSDDHGKTWQLGGTVGPQCNESQVVELADGSLMLNIRSYRGNYRRLVSFSKDGGQTWSKPVEDDTLLEPTCQASIVRYDGDKGGLLFSSRQGTARWTDRLLLPGRSIEEMAGRCRRRACKIVRWEQFDARG